MKFGSRLTSVMAVMLALTLFFCGDILALDTNLQLKTPKTVKQPKVEQPGSMRAGRPDLMCPNPWISVENINSPQGPFAGDCNCCFKQGYMLMAKAMCYVRNVGNGPSDVCRARLTWMDRNNARQERIVDLPAIEAGAQTLVNVVFASAQAFSVAYPVTLTIDSLNQVSETNESNNIVSFDFQQFRQQYSDQFLNCQ